MSGHYPSYPGDQPEGSPGSTPPPPPYGSTPAPYGPPPWAGPGRAEPTGREYAGWWSRVGAYLLDTLAVFAVAIVPVVVGLVVLFEGTEVSSVTGEVTGANPAGVPILVAGWLLALAFDVWNRVFRQGRHGQSIGKRVVGLRLVGDTTGEPIGAGAAFGRWITVFLIGFVPCGGLIDVLWPLWDEKNQTLHDKIVSSVVIA